MSYYKDIYHDFPLRCGKIWNKLRNQAEENKLDVTFMLMTAAGGLAAPFEHLKIKSDEASNAKDHPAFDKSSKDHYEKVLCEMKAAIDCELAKSKLFSKVDLTRWKIRKFHKRGEIIGYLERPSQDIGETLTIKSARDVIKIFRNALAHSNFHAFNRSEAPEIDEIAFFSEAYDYEAQQRTLKGYDVISLPHSDFATFLDKWFNLLKNIDPSATELREILPKIFEYSDAA